MEHFQIYVERSNIINNIDISSSFDFISNIDNLQVGGIDDFFSDIEEKYYELKESVSNAVKNIKLKRELLKDNILQLGHMLKNPQDIFIFIIRGVIGLFLSLIFLLKLPIIFAFVMKIVYIVIKVKKVKDKVTGGDKKKRQRLSILQKQEQEVQQVQMIQQRIRQKINKEQKTNNQNYNSNNSQKDKKIDTKDIKPKEPQKIKPKKSFNPKLKIK